jgi:helix-turn-helix protein
MAIELPDGRGESNDVLDALRLRAVHARELGYTVVDIAAILGVREETVSRWCSRYDRGGREALPGDRTGRPIGSGRLLTGEQEQRLQEAIETQCPEKLKIPSVSPGASKPATHGRFKTSHDSWGFSSTIRLYPAQPSVQSIRWRPALFFRPGWLPSVRRFDLSSGGRRSPGPAQSPSFEALPEPGGALAGFESGRPPSEPGGALAGFESGSGSGDAPGRSRRR